ncbi:demethoxyubiquinone hydroxylase family protein [Sphingobium sp. HWE2-09]|jgi:ubiquinone biosynthesis monooxygenase Coq7|uniref:demethoxyubiquinone hydroxylase family protein n=1 Tax=Sphingobium sp. HWE2-09 TaxID=3108390 RepID=UPI002DC45688|nr:demethoxyubiquinone hydroxylase family protein [Sphingobium sp. HWE2-09]
MTAPQDFPRPGKKPSAADRAAMVRVDQAGEFGATRIYAGQLAVMGDRHPYGRLIAGMAAQEERHRAAFDAMIARRGVRPTALAPIWSAAGFALGAVTAAMGPKAAMACTAAIETEIDRHYAEQLTQLAQDDPELSTAIADFQAEEVEHRDAALAHGAEQAPAYPLLSGAIRLGCRAAIALSKRI